MNVFESLAHSKQYKENPHRAAALVAGVWDSNAWDLILASAVHLFCYSQGGIGGSCFYSTLGGIRLATGRYVGGAIVAGANVYDGTNPKLKPNTHVAHAASMAIGFVAGKFGKNYFGTTVWF